MGAKKMIIEHYLNRRIQEATCNIELRRESIASSLDLLHAEEKFLEQLYEEMQRVCTHPNEKTVLGYVYCDQCKMLISEPNG